MDQIGNRIRPLAELVVFADLGIAPDTVALHARELERLPELLVVLVLRRGEHIVHVAGVIFAEFERVGNRQLGIKDRPPREREQHAEALIGGVRTLCGKYVQILSQDLRPRDPPFIVCLGGSDLLFRLGLLDCGLRLSVLPNRRGHQPGHTDDEGRQEGRIILDKLAHARGLWFIVLGSLVFGAHGLSIPPMARLCEVALLPSESLLLCLFLLVFDSLLLQALDAIVL